jgi:hypothetical protein
VLVRCGGQLDCLLAFIIVLVVSYVWTPSSRLAQVTLGHRDVVVLVAHMIFCMWMYS